MAPAANIGVDAAIFEAVHGSAPDLAGKDVTVSAFGLVHIHESADNRPEAADQGKEQRSIDVPLRSAILMHRAKEISFFTWFRRELRPCFSIAFGAVVVRIWRHPPWVGGCVTAILLSVELPFFLSSLVKFAEDGWFPIANATALMAVMLTWHKGKALIRALAPRLADAPGQPSAEALGLPIRCLACGPYFHGPWLRPPDLLFKTSRRAALANLASGKLYPWRTSSRRRHSCSPNFSGFQSYLLAFKI
jgi:K+ potassium transporter/Isocitrate/isopropylmalate dehydrogenase